MFLFGLLVFLVSGPLAAEMIGPNRIYGLALPRVRKDERVWYAANKLAGRNGLVLGAALILLSLVSGWLGGFLTSITALAMVGFALGNAVMNAAWVAKLVDSGGPLIDTQSSFDRNRVHDAEKARQSLFDKLGK